MKRAFLILAVALIAILVMLAILSRFFVDLLWFDSLGFRAVFTTVWLTMIVVFAIASVLSSALLLLSGFIAPAPLELSFSRAEIGTLFLGVLIAAIVAGDGRSNWYKGVQLTLVYAMIAILFYFLPAGAH